MLSKYRRRMMPELAGRELVIEHVDSSHVRFYFPDCKRQLWLILNNQGTIDALSEDILLAEFGVSYMGLSLGWAITTMKTHINLDDRCLWPKELFPCRQRAHMPMPDMPGLPARDAWI